MRTVDIPTRDASDTVSDLIVRACTSVHITPAARARARRGSPRAPRTRRCRRAERRSARRPRPSGWRARASRSALASSPSRARARARAARARAVPPAAALRTARGMTRACQASSSAPSAPSGTSPLLRATKWPSSSSSTTCARVAAGKRGCVAGDHGEAAATMIWARSSEWRERARLSGVGPPRIPARTLAPLRRSVRTCATGANSKEWSAVVQRRVDSHQAAHSGAGCVICISCS